MVQVGSARVSNRPCAKNSPIQPKQAFKSITNLKASIRPPIQQAKSNWEHQKDLFRNIRDKEKKRKRIQETDLRMGKQNLQWWSGKSVFEKFYDKVKWTHSAQRVNESTYQEKLFGQTFIRIGLDDQGNSNLQQEKIFWNTKNAGWCNFS